MSTDALAAAIAAEEHRQGRPYTADPEHCDGCADVDRCWEQATCEHGSYVEMYSLGSARSVRSCLHCGTVYDAKDQP